MPNNLRNDATSQIKGPIRQKTTDAHVETGWDQMSRIKYKGAYYSTSQDKRVELWFPFQSSFDIPCWLSSRN
jgi:hypothetical protein